MTTRSRLRISATLLILLLGASATASDRNSRTVKLFYPTTLGGTHVEAGQYSVKMESHSPEVTLTFLKEGHVVATTQGRWGEHSPIPTRNAVVYDANKDGSEAITEIRFQGMKEVVLLDESSRVAQRDDRTTQGAHAANR